MERGVSMADYVTLDGVRTWYDDAGSGEPLVLLHPGGAGVDSRAFGPNLPALTPVFRVLHSQPRAHGRTPDVEGPLSFEGMAAGHDPVHREVVGGRTRLLGVSEARS